MPESLLNILKLLLLALIYLFFFRVLRAVWAEVATPRTATPGAPGARGRAAPPARGPRGAKGTPTKVKVVDPAGQRGQAFSLAGEVTVGRAAGCQVRVDDTYASQLHARVFEQDGAVFVEDLGSTNGTYLNRRGTKNKEKVTAAVPLRPGDRLIVGKTILEAQR